ncbi:DUF2500 domain-containing protein [Bacillus sp. 1P06AnD]|uniref:DUF2500 domain-containing protein n=1 Tax=Bacillus sp. 1P06AnD TaxID=3132208 RepID=UPI0039A386F4
MTGDRFFDGLATVFPIVFVTVFGLIVCVFIAGLVGGIATWRKNNRLPVLDVSARVVAKRHKAGGGGETSVHQSYFVTFEVASGDRMELQVRGDDFGQLCEGDEGALRFQGTRFVDFQRYREKESAF